MHERSAIYNRLKALVISGSDTLVANLLLYPRIRDIHGHFCADLDADMTTSCVTCEALLRPPLRQRNKQNARLIKLLLQHGAYPPVDVCASEYRYGRRDKALTPLKRAVESGCSVDDVEKLLSLGADVNLQPQSICVKRNDVSRDFECTDCDTPLMAAVRRRDVAMIRVLIANGANVSAEVYTEDEDDFSKTALAVAAATGDEHVITELVTSGADVNQSLGPRGTVLHHFCDNDKIVNLLVRLGSDPNIRDDTGESVFSNVLQRCHVLMSECRSNLVLQSLRLLMPTTRDLDHYLNSKCAIVWLKRKCTILMLQHGARLCYNHVLLDEYSEYFGCVYDMKPKKHSEKFIELLRAADTDFRGVRQQVVGLDRRIRKVLNLDVLDQKLSQPLTLQTSCVISVRRRLRSISDVGMWARIDALSLPSIIKDRLKLLVW